MESIGCRGRWIGEEMAGNSKGMTQGETEAVS
jgi:hypothetical protein